MECFEFGYVIKGDVNDTLKKTVEYCSDGIKQKAKVLAGYIQSDDFLEFCKKDEKFDSTKSILENKQNTVRRILKQYYELKHQDVTTAAAKRQADLLMGFSSVKARNIAINDTATIISLLYEQERKSSKYNNVKLNRVKIIQKAIDALEKDYINNVALKVYNQNKEIDDNTIKEFKEAYDKLKSDNPTGLIIDLRNNGGGIVSEALKIADFIADKDSVLLYEVDKNGKETVKKSENDPIVNMPIIVLVNGNTASSSEILAGALKDLGKAKIVGTKTYGKGVIQEILTLADGSGLKITTEEYQTPNRNKIHKKGIEPDENVELKDTVTNETQVEEKDDTQLQKAIEMLK